jgi:hypothetical protein
MGDPLEMPTCFCVLCHTYRVGFGIPFASGRRSCMILGCRPAGRERSASAQAAQFGNGGQEPGKSGRDFRCLQLHSRRSGDVETASLTFTVGAGVLNASWG